MSNKIESSTEEVKIRYQATVSKKIADAFNNECRQRNWEPRTLLRVILEERYDASRE